MADGKLMLAGMKIEDVYSEITKAGITEADAATIIGSWIFENLGKTKRTFSYKTGFPAEEPECTPTFARSFEHADWIDGESVVQAEETVGEDGFNVRFHQIEDDLDAMGADVARAFACLAEMRRDLRTLLDEIRSELNRLNADVYDCCNRPTRPQFPTFPTFPVGDGPFIEFEYLDTMKFLDKYVQVFRSDKGLVMLPAIEQIKVQPGADPRVQRTAKLGRFVIEDKQVREVFPQAVTKADFVRRFGRAEVADGRSVRELVDILPDGSEYDSIDVMVEDVARREAAALRTSDMGTTAIRNAFGLDIDVRSVGEAPVERFANVPPAARAVLLNNGIDTMAKLAEADPGKVGELLAREKIAAGTPDAAEWIFSAKTLVATR